MYGSRPVELKNRKFAKFANFVLGVLETFTLDPNLIFVITQDMGLKTKYLDLSGQVMLKFALLRNSQISISRNSQY